MNLYTPRRKQEVQTHPVSSYRLYLSSLKKETPGINPELKFITSISNEKENRTLYVLSANGLYYLSDSFIINEGMANILYSSSNIRRVINYGNQLIKSLSPPEPILSYQRETNDEELNYFSDNTTPEQRLRMAQSMCCGD